MQANAYFKIGNREEGLALCLFPATSGGKGLLKFEVSQYLKSVGIDLINTDALDEGWQDFAVEKEIIIREEPCPAIDEIITVTVSEDKMSAAARFYAPANGGQELSKNCIIRALEEAKVLLGIKDDVIDAWLEERVYCTDIVLAEGQEPGESHDAFITYKFELDKPFSPTMNEDGSINFHELNLLNDVAQDDVLAILTPEVIGEDGFNITGNSIPSRRPGRKMLKIGKNVKLSANGLGAIAMCHGHVTLENEKLVVHNVYNIKGNVGPETGNIDFDGCVSVSGDVQAGYTIDATGDIIIQGVVEATTLRAGGDIVLASGVYGGGNAEIISAKNVSAKFLQESNVKAGGSVNAGSILYSKVEARDSVYATADKGLVRGSEVRARVLIAVKTVGSAFSGGSSQLEVGSDPNDIDKYNTLMEALAAKRVKQTKAKQNIAFFKKKIETLGALNAEQDSQYKLAKMQFKEMSTEIVELYDEFNALKEIIERSARGQVIVEGTIYSGAKVIISSTAYYVQADIVRCKLTKKNMDIVIESI